MVGADLLKQFLQTNVLDAVGLGLTILLLVMERHKSTETCNGLDAYDACTHCNPHSSVVAGKIITPNGVI